ncbi:unnamed protein product [Durusdinium trenchii]|uniref:Uncharacterized protein n=1 Tax=Durusdinium trenchii TaxID=1381693 RepID=A0ABP0JMD6_9DINO
MSVGLLLTANSVPCGAHAKREYRGMDIRPRQILATSFHDHTVQHLHLTSTFKKTKRHLKVLQADMATPLRRIRSEPQVSSDTVAGPRGLGGRKPPKRDQCEVPSVELAGPLQKSAYKPVWDLPEEPMEFSKMESLNDSWNRSRSSLKVLAE